MAEIDKVLSSYVRQLTPSQVPDFEHIKAGARRRSHTRAAAVVVGTAAVVVTGVTIAVGAQSSGPDSTIVAITAPATVATSPTPGQASQRIGAIPDTGAARCADSYSPRAVKDRSFAFDGTVIRIGRGTTDRPDGKVGYAAVTFTVHEWFRGGTSPEVTADMTPPSSKGDDRAGPSYESGPSYEIGSRLLVSGEPRWGGTALQDALVLGCGFTRYYDTQTATAWRQAAR